MEHFVNNHSLESPYPEDTEQALFGMGCFWGAEKRFWELGEGIYATAVGYAGGHTESPNYKEVCTGTTNHNEVVLVIYHPDVISYADLLKTFWESHNPTQGMRQGNDVGTQYRSGVYYYSEAQKELALKTKVEYQQALTQSNHPTITTEIITAPKFYFAEEYHQQYLAKNPSGYCGLGGLGLNLD